MNRSLLHRTLSVGIGATLLGWCAWYLGTVFEWGAILTILGRADPLWLLLGCGVLSVAQMAVRTLRWTVLLRTVHCEARFVDLYFFTVVSVSLAAMTPGQAGEAIKVEWLRKHGLLGRLPGYGSFLMERAADLLIVGILAVLSPLLSPSLVAEPAHLRTLLAATTVVLSLGLLAFLRLKPGGSVGHLRDSLRGTIGDLRVLARVLALTMLSWLLVMASWQVCLLSIGMHLAPTEALSLVSLVTLAHVLSLLPGGLGVSEVVTAGLLARMGHAAPAAQAGALILRCLGLLLILNGALHLALWRPARRARRGWAGLPRDQADHDPAGLND
jgi:uncharacterized membrane protein YbhN (UPF0104 family)